MIYKKFKELNLSMLGMGNMRLPTTKIEGKDSIDESKAKEIIEYAYHHGINYFDTAYRYHGGASESFVGKVLNQFPRDTWYIASKMPGHMMNYKDGKLGFQGYLAGEKIDSIAEIFEEQLEKCGVEYFDFYLLHNLCESSYEFYTNEELGVVDYLLEQKRLGRIRYLGFSAHGRADTIEKFIEWRDCFDFAQIQLNYLDWSLQDAAKKYDILTKHDIPIIVMEPCRGGKLATLPKNVEAILKDELPDDSIASWAFRYLQALDNVQVVLSGMTTLAQLQDNLSTFDKANPITSKEQLLLDQVVDKLTDFVPCTACRYCCEDCPQGLDIPKLISMYNEFKMDGIGILNYNLRGMEESELPSACIGCGACSHACPQGIDIPKIMQDFAKALKS